MPYLPNPQGNVDRINKQIEDLTNMKNQYQNMIQPQPQAPIQNIINTNNGSNSDFEARFLKDSETPDTIMIQKKTLFIDEKNSKITIKEANGDISKTYDIVVPKDPKDLKIEQLELELNDIKKRLDKKGENINEQQHFVPDTKIRQSNGNDTKHD